MYAFTHKRRDYEQCGWNALALISPFPRNDSVIWVSDVGVVKQIVNDRVLFPKPLERYQAINVYGRNVVTTEGEEWKRHRRVSQPAFSERNNKLVWNAATNTMNELFEDVWGIQKTEVRVDNLLDVTVRVALIILSIAGFGKDMNWKSDSESLSESNSKDTDSPAASPTPDTHNTQRKSTTKHTISFTQSLVLISTHIVMNIAVPTWLKFITSKTREVKRAAEELGSYMDEIINARIEEGASGSSSISTTRGDLLSNLVAASSREESAASDNKISTSNFLSHSELRGNTFVYLIAGHETTAHTLCYMYALLALYPAEQEKLYAHIKEVVGEREATFEDFGRLTRIIAAFYETLRMFPPVTTIAKRTSAATIFANVSAADPHSSAVKDMYVPEGSMVYIHTPGLHYNERYWSDPYTFKPERFMGDWNKDAFLPFSGGARACIGRRFSEVEAVAITLTLLRSYSIHLAPEKEEEYERLGLDVYERTERLTKSVNMITLTPLDVPLVFRKRNSV